MGVWGKCLCEKEAMMVTLGKLLRQLCAQTPLVVSLPDDLPFYGAHAFGEWLAELCTGWSTRFANEDAILRLDGVFGQVAYGNPKQVIRLYLLPSWDALTKHLPEIQRGVAAAFAEAQRWGED
jgi:hypothetical protein